MKKTLQLKQSEFTFIKLEDCIMRDFIFYANSKNVFSLVVEVLKSTDSSQEFATVMLHSIPHLIFND